MILFLFVALDLIKFKVIFNWWKIIFTLLIFFRLSSNYMLKNPILQGWSSKKKSWFDKTRGLMMVKEAKESTLSPPFYTFNSVKPFPIKITSNQWLFQSLLRATLLSHLAMRVLTQLISLVSVCSCGLRVFGDDNVLDLNIKFHDFGKIISRCLTSKNLYTTRRVKITFLYGFLIQADYILMMALRTLWSADHYMRCLENRS